VCGATWGSAEHLVFFSNMPPSRSPSTLLTDKYMRDDGSEAKLSRTYTDYKDARWLLEHAATTRHDNFQGSLPLGALPLSSISAYFYSPEKSSLTVDHLSSEAHAAKTAASSEAKLCGLLPIASFRRLLCM
jgi:hypothetical protein